MLRFITRRLLLLAAVGGAAWWATRQVKDQRFTLDEAGWRQARDAVASLDAQVSASGAWNPSQTLQHLAQSIEGSLDGFPTLKPPLFRDTVGSAAFALFVKRGTMTHGLAEPIPGMPDLDPALPLAQAQQDLLAAMDRFAAHGGALRPHFAYGELDKDAMRKAHLMHLGAHWAELKGGAAGRALQPTTGA